MRRRAATRHSAQRNYQLGQTLVLGPQNSGVTWMAAPGETPVLSGSVPVSGWVPDKDSIWKANLTALRSFANST